MGKDRGRAGRVGPRSDPSALLSSPVARLPRVALAAALLCSCVSSQLASRPEAPAEVSVAAAEPPPNRNPVEVKAVEVKAPEPRVPEVKTPSGSPLGDLIAARAAALVGLASLRRVERDTPDDCSGMVEWVFSQEGITLLSEPTTPKENASAALFRQAKRVGAVRRQAPRRGDLVFFRETYDKNRDGRRNDGVTHVGIVESIDEEGTVTFIHRAHNGVKRSLLNTRFPKQRDLNDYLRREPTRSSFTGELFSGYVSPEVLGSRR